MAQEEGGVQFQLESWPEDEEATGLPSLDGPAGRVVESEQARSSGAAGGNTSNDAAELDWLSDIRVGYDGGFVVASERERGLDLGDLPYRLRVNGWGQLRLTRFDSANTALDLNQFQLVRGRLVLSGSALSPDLDYFVQLDGRSSSGDTIRLLDYFMDFDLGRHRWGWDEGTLGLHVGRYKMPFTLARFLSAREFEFTDRSVASTFFDVNRSLGAGAFGKLTGGRVPIYWEAAIFNGFVTGGAQSGSAGNLDNNFAVSGRLLAFPTGEWGEGGLADFEWHPQLATRCGLGLAATTIDRNGPTEFDSIRVVDSGAALASILPADVDSYRVVTSALDASLKYRGWSATMEYYLRTIYDFEGDSVPTLLDHGFWAQVGKFVVPRKLELLARWSRVNGDSGTLGAMLQSSEERSAALAWYFREQNAKVVLDAAYLDGAPISSSALDIQPGYTGWLLRTQLQFAF